MSDNDEDAAFLRDSQVPINMSAFETPPENGRRVVEPLVAVWTSMATAWQRKRRGRRRPG